MLNQSISISTCLYSGLQLRNNQPPQILIQKENRIIEIFDPFLHQLKPSDIEECLNDLLRVKSAEPLIKDIIEFYAEGEEGAIYLVAREHNIPLPEIAGWIKILKAAGMIYPGMQLSQSPKAARAAV